MGLRKQEDLEDTGPDGKVQAAAQCSSRIHEEPSPEVTPGTTGSGGPLVSHANHNLAACASRLKIADRVRRLAEGERPVDNRLHTSRLNQLL